MQFQSPTGIITLLNEPSYSFGSTDNHRQYPIEQLLISSHSPNSIHGILLNDRPLIVLGDSGGCTGIHEHSLMLHNEAVYVAVGRHVVKLILRPFSVAWALQVDDATCFGVYINVERNALMSHGEMTVCRFSETGAVIWSTHGADIFSEGFSLHPEYVQVIDFNHNSYKFSYDHGDSCF